MTEPRIRWEDTPVGTISGHVGSIEQEAFAIWKPPQASGEWVLESDLPGLGGVRCYGDDPEKLKAKAEDWLAGFVSSLGAVFPEPEKPDPDCEECGFGLPRHDEDCSHYAMTCKHCKKPIIRCDVLPSHFGCSSAYGYIHDDPRAHACEPRSDGPYAQPESDHA